MCPCLYAPRHNLVARQRGNTPALGAPMLEVSDQLQSQSHCHLNKLLRLSKSGTDLMTKINVLPFMRIESKTPSSYALRFQ
jgi:hypothetical protein